MEKTMIENIANSLGVEELLCQLAEECAELAQAANHYRRTLSKKNQARMSENEAKENLIEEIADVSLCLKVLGADSGIIRMKANKIMAEKMERWSSVCNITLAPTAAVKYPPVGTVETEKAV